MKTLTIAYALPEAYAVYQDGSLIYHCHEEPPRKLLEALGYTVSEGLLMIPRCIASTPSTTAEFDYIDNYQWSPPGKLETLTAQVSRYNRRIRREKMTELHRALKILEDEDHEANDEELRQAIERSYKE